MSAPSSSQQVDQNIRLVLVDEVLDKQTELHEATLDLLEQLAAKRELSKKLRAYRQFKPHAQRDSGPNGALHSK